MSERSALTKTITVFAVSLGIGMGLCGLSMVLPSSDVEFHTNWLSVPSLLIMVLSFLGLVAMLLVGIIGSLAGNFSANRSAPQTLFGSSDEERKDTDGTS